MAGRTLTAAQVAGIVAAVEGGPPPGTSVAEWVATARNESSFRTAVRNGSYVGLWQIGDFHGPLVKRHTGYSLPTDRAGFGRWLESPLHNWTAAKAVYAAQGWRAWEASHRPSPADTAAARSPDHSVATSGGAVAQGGEVGPERGVEAENVLDIFGFATDVPGQLAKIAGVLIDAGQWIADRNNWSRVALVVGGGTVAVAALTTLARPALEPVADAAAKAVTKGATR